MIGPPLGGMLFQACAPLPTDALHFFVPFVAAAALPTAMIAVVCTVLPSEHSSVDDTQSEANGLGSNTVCARNRNRFRIVLVSAGVVTTACLYVFCAVVLHQVSCVRVHT